MGGAFHLLAPAPYKVALSQAFRQLRNGDLRWSDVISASSGGVVELSEREALQQGRVPKTLKRARCVDSWRGCESGPHLTAETCSADAELRERCCRSCHTLTCVDTSEHCEGWALADQCLDNVRHRSLPFSLDLRPSHASHAHPALPLPCLDLISHALSRPCVHPQPDYMLSACCFSCSPDPDDPCSLDPSSRPDVYKGDISKTFERILREFPQYTPTAHSRDPWVVSFDNLLSDAECDGIIEAVGGPRGEYIRPSTTAKPVRQANGQVVLTDVPDQIRTSHNAWCQHRSCYDHPVHERVITRIMDMVGLPPNNAEHMQLLKYGPGEYYRLHHDWIPEQLDAACGPRAFTFFLYLSDVDEGGGTHFPYLNLTVHPKRGSAVLWPHGLDTNPREKDVRTHHEAMPVVQGTKWGANYWIHGRDFKLAMASGCDGRQGQPKRSRLLKDGLAEKRVKEDESMRNGAPAGARGG